MHSLTRNILKLSLVCLLATGSAWADSARILKIEPRTMAVYNPCDWDGGESDASPCPASRSIASPETRQRSVTVYEVTYDYGGRIMRDTLSYLPINDVEVDRLGRARRVPYDNKP